MAIKKIGIAEFLELAVHYPVMDVRSPGEFNHAHIPGAHPLPLFTDEERKVVGTEYKQDSRQTAIKTGLKYFGKKMVPMIEQVESVMSRQLAVDSKNILVHCWRGGMRSAGVAWLLDLYGYKVYTLAGGYKAYRNWVLQQFTKEYNIRIVGGYTGSGKTTVLKELQHKGEAIVDIEAIASHKGSAFGNIGLPKQPSQEMFENVFAAALSSVNCDPTSIIWMEDESQRIGDVNIPSVFFGYMRTKPVLFLDIPFEERLDHIVEEYGKLDKSQVMNAIIRIQKRLGGMETKNAVNHLIEGNVKESFRILLKYYDKWYGKSLQMRDEWEMLVTRIACKTCDASVNAGTLQQIISNQPEKVNG